MELYCRHCWKDVEPKLSENGPHIQGICPKCNNWIKFLNNKERKIALIEGVKIDAARTRLQKIRHSS